MAAWNDLLKQLLAAEAMSGTLGDVERRLAKDRTALLHPMLELYIGARSALEPPIEVVGAARTCARARGPSKLFIGFPSSTGMHDMKIRHIAIAILTMVIWALSFTVIKIGLRGVPPLMICALRLFLVSLPWVIIIKRPMVSYHKIVACGVFMFLMQLGFMTCGMYAGTSAGLSAVIMQAQIPFTIVLAVIFLNEKPSAMQSVGALIALGGIIFLASNIGGDITAAGFLLTILAAASQASSNIIVRGFGKVNVVALIIWSSLFAWPPLLVMSLILEGPDRILQSTLHMSWFSIGAVLYIAYPATLIGFALWSRLLSLYPAAIVSSFTLLIPVLATVISALVLREDLQLWKMTATGVVLFGLCVSIFGPRFVTRTRMAVSS